MSKPRLILLHGALGAVDQFDRLAPLLAGDFEIHRLNFEGHGSTPLAHKTFHYKYFVDNLRAYLQQQNLSGVSVFGYSLGGYIACALAQAEPELIGSIVTLATKFIWTGEVVKREVRYLDVETIKAKVPKFAGLLAARHTAEGWEKVVNCTKDLLWSNTETGGLTPEFIAGLPQRIRVMVGDRDHTVGVEESLSIYQALQQGEFEVLPQTQHPFEKVSLERLVFSLRDFLGTNQGLEK